MQTEPTIKSLDNRMNVLEKKMDDLMEVLQSFAASVEKRFDSIEQRLERVEHRLDRVEATMATKSYVDYRLADLKGDLMLLINHGSRA